MQDRYLDNPPSVYHEDPYVSTAGPHVESASVPPQSSEMAREFWRSGKLRACFTEHSAHVTPSSRHFVEAPPTYQPELVEIATPPAPKGKVSMETTTPPRRDANHIKTLFGESVNRLVDMGASRCDAAKALAEADGLMEEAAEELFGATPEPVSHNPKALSGSSVESAKARLKAALINRRQVYSETVEQSRSDFMRQLENHVSDMQTRSCRMRDCFTKSMHRTEPVLSPRPSSDQSGCQDKATSGPTDPTTTSGNDADEQDDTSRWDELEKQVEEEYRRDSQKRAGETREKRRLDEEKRKTDMLAAEEARWNRAKAKLQQLSKDRNRLVHDRELEQQQRRRAFEAQLNDAQKEYDQSCNNHAAEQQQAQKKSNLQQQVYEKQEQQESAEAARQRAQQDQEQPAWQQRKEEAREQAKAEQAQTDLRRKKTWERQQKEQEGKAAEAQRRVDEERVCAETRRAEAFAKRAKAQKEQEEREEKNRQAKREQEKKEIERQAAEEARHKRERARLDKEHKNRIDKQREKVNKERQEKENQEKERRQREQWERERREKERREREQRERREKARQRSYTEPRKARSVPDPKQFSRKGQNAPPRPGSDGYTQYQWQQQRKAGPQTKYYTNHNNFAKSRGGASGQSSSRQQNRTSNTPKSCMQDQNRMPQTHEQRWDNFESDKGTIRLNDIPFPSMTTLTAQARNKETYKKLALRWHPDKFLQNFGTRLCKSQHDGIMDKVKETFQAINGAREGKVSFAYMQAG